MSVPVATCAGIVQRRSGASLQAGQAVLEALVCMLAVAVLWTAITWLGRIQDIDLHALHAARIAAFSAARQQKDDVAHVVPAAIFESPGLQWIDRKGRRLISTAYQDITVSFDRGGIMPADAQVGGAFPQVAQLRSDWNMADKGVLSARVTLDPTPPTTASGRKNPSSSVVPVGFSLGLEQFDRAFPPLRRHISILAGSGHSSGDLDAATRLAKSDLAWSKAAENSYRQGRKVSSVATRIDSAWGRPEPVFDWLTPWSAHLPSHHLHVTSGQVQP